MILLRYICESILASGAVGFAIKAFVVLCLLRIVRVLIRAWLSMGKK